MSKKKLQQHADEFLLEQEGKVEEGEIAELEALFLLPPRERSLTTLSELAQWTADRRKRSES